MEILPDEDSIKIAGPASVALGTFDGVHLGHASVIRAAKEAGLVTIVATFTRHPSEVLKNRRVKELMSTGLKEKSFEQLGVDALFYLDFESVRDMSPEAFLHGKILSRLNAAYVFCGFNYRFGRGGEAGPEELKAICSKYGAVGISLPPVCDGGEPVSSTRIRSLVEDGRMPEAARLLGRPFELYFEVVHGRRLGRELGAPTINQIIPVSHISPRYGVYASVTHVGGKAMPSVTNVGVKPTVGSSGVSAETYILGFDSDLYGRSVGVGLIEFLRPEKKFESLEALRRQIKKDAYSAGAVIDRYLKK
jgi:riboflavin kinase/FMN adenylyltransferase